MLTKTPAQSRRLHWLHTTLAKGNWGDFGDLPGDLIERALEDLALATYRREGSRLDQHHQPTCHVHLEARKGDDLRICQTKVNQTGLEPRLFGIYTAITQARKTGHRIISANHIYEGYATQTDGDTFLRNEALVMMVWPFENERPRIATSVFTVENDVAHFHRVICVSDDWWETKSHLQGPTEYGNIWADAETADMSGVHVRRVR